MSDGGIDIGNLHRDRAHVGAELLDETVDGAALDDRLAELDRVVPDPGHTPASPDGRVVEPVFLEDTGAGQPSQRVPA